LLKIETLRESNDINLPTWGRGLHRLETFEFALARSVDVEWFRRAAL